MLGRAVFPSGVGGCHTVREASFLSPYEQCAIHRSPLIAPHKLPVATQRDSSV